MPPSATLAGQSSNVMPVFSAGDASFLPLPGGSGITLVERAFHPFQALSRSGCRVAGCSRVRDPNHHFPGKARTPLGIERLGPVG
jgi:hypothetical protein